MSPPGFWTVSNLSVEIANLAADLLRRVVEFVDTESLVLRLLRFLPSIEGVEVAAVKAIRLVKGGSRGGFARMRGGVAQILPRPRHDLCEVGVAISRVPRVGTVLGRHWWRYRITSDLGEKLASKLSRNGSAPGVVEHAHPDAIRRAGPVYAASEQHGSGAYVVGSHFTNDVVRAVEKLHSVLHGRPRAEEEEVPRLIMIWPRR